MGTESCLVNRYSEQHVHHFCNEILKLSSTRRIVTTGRHSSAKLSCSRSSEIHHGAFVGSSTCIAGTRVKDGGVLEVLLPKIEIPVPVDYVIGTSGRKRGQAFRVLKSTSSRGKNLGF